MTTSQPSSSSLNLVPTFKVIFALRHKSIKYHVVFKCLVSSPSCCQNLHSPTLYVEFQQKFPHCNISHLPAQLPAVSAVSSPGSTLLFIFSTIKYILSPSYSHKRALAAGKRELSTGDCRSAILLAFNFSPFPSPFLLIKFCSDKLSIPVP